ncbi:MAG: MFS transporter [Flavobacterium sp.]|nr:MFS transporter [Flavobacterium sp.]
MKTASKKIINGWAMYDWANSVYNLVITSTMFPAYFEAVTKNDATHNQVHFLGRTYVNTALYNYALGFAFLIVAIMSPILSSIADYKGNKKSFLRFFSTMGSLACSCLYFFNKDTVTVGIFLVIIACIGFWSSLVFYNAYLPEIAAEEDQDRVSAKGFTMGYIGSVLLQIVCFILFFKGSLIGLQETPALQISFLLVGIWWFGFAQIPLKVLPNGTPAAVRPQHSIFTNGFIELKKVFAQIKQLPILKRYLGAFFCYNMGVQTIMLAATLYGKSELNIPVTNLIIAILLIQLVAIPGSLLMSKLSGKFGNLQVLAGVVVIWVICCVLGYLIPRDGIYQFYGLATIVGFVMGGIQSLSRSTYAKLMPETKDTTSFFSFYDVTEKIAIVIGMFSYGYITELAGGSQRNSILALMTFFIVGLLLLIYTIKAEKKHTQVLA